MSTISSFSSRTTALLLGDRLLAALRTTQLQMAKAQDAIATGKEVSKPSDSPAKTSAIQLIQAALEARAQHRSNLDFAGTILDNIDAALGDATNLVMEAKSIGSSQIGIGASAETRKNQATVIDAQLRSLLDIANRQSQGIALFGGNSTRPGANAQPMFAFVDELGGIRYTGSRTSLAADLGLRDTIAFNSNGVDAFRALSARIAGTRDLDPLTSGSTLLTDLAGTQNVGVRQGSFVLTVDTGMGIARTTVDLANARTMEDVRLMVQDALDNLDPAAGTIAVGSHGFSLTANAGKSITISDNPGGTTALDLGLNLTVAGTTQVGGDVNLRLTSRTRLADLGVSVDQLSGMRITQGPITKTADFSSCVTIQDMQNVIQSLNLGVRLEVNDAGTGLNLVSEMSGPTLSLGEVGAGTTVADLGLSPLTTATALAELNFGHGVHVNNIPGRADFTITLSDGRSLGVKLGGATTVNDVFNAIINAGAALPPSEGGPITVGFLGGPAADIHLGIDPQTNGLIVRDNTGGAGTFAIRDEGPSTAATDLGIAGTGVAGQITGADVSQVRTESVFTHLLALREALNRNDERGITLATSALETDVDALTQTRADVGVRSQRINQEKDRSDTMKLAEETMLTDLQGTDMTEVITRYTQLVQQLQAALRIGAQNLQMSLFDFLK